jgi:hypothetical protein
MKALGPPQEKNTDLEIAAQPCKGNFMSNSELTALSAQAAKCLSKSQETDLFLNGIEELSPEAAKYLFQWDGKWICLNGLKKLPPKVARHLWNWKGQWISLNGLSDLTLDSVKDLPKWQGTRLELMGLTYQGKPWEQMGLKYLERWENSGGKVFVPHKIRKIMDQLQR